MVQIYVHQNPLSNEIHEQIPLNITSHISHISSGTAAMLLDGIPRVSSLRHQIIILIACHVASLTTAARNTVANPIDGTCPNLGNTYVTWHPSAYLHIRKFPKIIILKCYAW